MTISNVSRAVVLALTVLVSANFASPARDDDRAPHLYPNDLPGTLGCVDDAFGRVTWGCD
jgi:hypothetical protein